MKTLIQVKRVIAVGLLSLSALRLPAAPIPVDKPANFPAWWFSRGIVVPLNSGNTNPSWLGHDYPASDDYAVFNQGQLKNIATAAYGELRADLTASVWQTGPGADLATEYAALTATSHDDYAVMNLGQLKAAAQPFYNLLGSLGYPNTFPASGNTADDYAAANIGQLKNLFSFDLSLAGPVNVAYSSGTLTWTLPSGNTATSILVEVQNADGTWSLVTTLPGTATTYTPSGGTHTSGAAFQVIAQNGNSYSTPGATPPDANLLPPTNLTTYAGIVDGEIDLAWQNNPNSDISTILVQQSSDNLHWTTIATLNPDYMSWAVTGLTDGQNYYFRLLLSADTNPAWDHAVNTMVPPVLSH